MHIRHGKQVIFSILIGAMIPGCGVVSDLMDKKSEKPSTSSTADEVVIHNNEVEPQTIGGTWQRTLQIIYQNKPVPNVVVEFKRLGKNNFASLGITNENGTIRDNDASKHTQYRIGSKILSKWYRASRDLIWTEKTLAAELAQNYSPLNFSKTIETNVSKIAETPQTIDATRIFIEKNAIVSWNKIAPLTLRAKHIRIDGSLFAYPDSRSEGLNAPPLNIECDLIEGNGHIDWSGNNGKPGTKGTNGAKGKDGTADHVDGGNGGNGADGARGGRGGNGGALLVICKRSDLLPTQLISNGGNGGSGGRGGAAGEGGEAGKRESFRDDTTTYLRGDRGKRGNPGANGERGEDGKAGEIKTLIDNPNTGDY